MYICLNSLDNENAMAEPYVLDACSWDGDALKMNIKSGSHKLGNWIWCLLASKQLNVAICDCGIFSYKKTVFHNRHKGGHFFCGEIYGHLMSLDYNNIRSREYIRMLLHRSGTGNVPEEDTYNWNVLDTDHKKNGVPAADFISKNKYSQIILSN